MGMMWMGDLEHSPGFTGEQIAQPELGLGGQTQLGWGRAEAGKLNLLGM